MAEIGVDMGRFPAAGYLASWAGMGPGEHQSGGKSRSVRGRDGDSWLQRHLAAAAMAAARTKDSCFAAQYAHLVRSLSKLKPRKAVGHSLLVVVWHILSTDATYQELGNEWFERRSSPKRRAWGHSGLGN